ncbi:hypothetical protein V8F33_001039, partial [Rhypophila sp. PSN 637]
MCRHAGRRHEVAGGCLPQVLTWTYRRPNNIIHTFCRISQKVAPRAVEIKYLPLIFFIAGFGIVRPRSGTDRRSNKKLSWFLANGCYYCGRVHKENPHVRYLWGTTIDAFLTNQLNTPNFPLCESLSSELQDSSNDNNTMARPQGSGGTKQLTTEERQRVRVLYFDANKSQSEIYSITGYTKAQIRTAIRAPNAAAGRSTGRPRTLT